MARKKSITKRRRQLFIEALRRTGNVSAAAIAGEIGRSSWYDLRGRDEAFKKEWDDAEREALDKIEIEAIRRATEGVIESKPYVDQRPDGKKETKFYDITRKSDRLLELILTRRHPDYKPVKALELTSPDGSMSPPQSDVNWDNLSDDEVEQLVELQRKLHASDAA